MSNTCKADHMHNMSLFVACADEMSHTGNTMAKKTTHSKGHACYSQNGET